MNATKIITFLVILLKSVILIKFLKVLFGKGVDGVNFTELANCSKNKQRCINYYITVIP